MTTTPQFIQPTQAPKHSHQQKKTAQKPYRHRRGEIWFVTGDNGSKAIGTEIWSNRPAVIISNDVFNESGGFAEIVYLSKSANKRASQTHVTIPAVRGTGTTTVLCEQVHTVDASRLKHKLGKLTPEQQKAVDKAIGFSLDLGQRKAPHHK